MVNAQHRDKGNYSNEAEFLFRKQIPLCYEKGKVHLIFIGVLFVTNNY